MRMLKNPKTLAAVLLCSSMAGIGLGLAIAQQGGRVDALPEPADDSSPKTSTYSMPAIQGPANNPAGGQGRLVVVRPKSKSGRAAKPVVVRQHYIADVNAQAAAAAEKRMNTYRGTVINLQASISLGNEAVQQRIAETFAKLDPQVPARAAHFSWVDQMPKLNPVGWIGFIEKLEPTQGGWLAEMTFSPKFAPRGGHITTTDYWTERWVYNASGLHQVPYLGPQLQGHAGSIVQD